jgi:hypothetical protein
MFSQQGAFTIVKYLDTTEKKSIWKQLKEFVTKNKEKVRKAFVNKSIVQNSSSLTFRANRHWLNKADTKSILSTSYPRLEKAFKDLQQSTTPLIIYEDFDIVDGNKQYSLSGLYKITNNLSSTLTVKNRKEWCEAIEVVAPSTFKLLISHQDAKLKRVQKACELSRKRDGNACQITKEKPSRSNKFNLASHHIFSKAHYPDLEDSLDNIITLKEEVHKEFHTYMGGTQNECTIDNLIEFVIQFYPEAEDAIFLLNNIKAKLKV